MLVRFWGTRGSVPAPGVSTVRYGGNTSCVEVRSGDSIAVMDCGTGARALGGSLLGLGQPLRVNLMLTHFHWDHIQGFPFFLPIFLPGSVLDVYGSAGLERGLEEAMAGQMQYTYFPVRLADLMSRIVFHEVGESTFRAGDIAVESQFLNHTCPTVGYRLTARGRSVAYVTDHEPFWPHNPDLPLQEALVHPGDLRHVEFVRGVDLLIHDAQYTCEEYPAKRGWGHSTIEYVVDLAITAGVKQLALFHHDPPRTDDLVDGVLERAKQRVRLRGASLDVVAAAEGLTLELEEHAEAQPVEVTVPSNLPTVLARLLIIGDVERRRLLRTAFVEDGYRISEANLDHRLDQLKALEPELVMVVLEAGPAAAAAVAAIRQEIGGRPLVAVLHGNVNEGLLRSMNGMVDDVVVDPYGLPNLRARVRAAINRGPRTAPLLEEAEESTVADRLHLVDRLSPAELDDMLRTSVRCEFRLGELIFNQGDPPAGVYYIEEGLVRVFVRREDGQDVTVGFAGIGDTVGEMSALDDAPRSASAQVVEPVRASYVPRDVFRHVLLHAPETSMRLMRLLARRLREVDNRLAAVRGPLAVADPRPGSGSPHLEGLLYELTENEERLGVEAQEAGAAYLRVRQWRRTVEVLRRIARIFDAGENATALARKTVEVTRDLLPGEVVALYGVRDGGLRRLAVSGRGAPQGWEPRAILAPLARALAASMPQVAPAQAFGGHGARVKWAVLVPLRSGDDALGLLWVGRATPPNDDELGIYEVIGAAVSLALVNGRSAADEPPLLSLEAALDLEVERARRLGYPIGVVVGTLARSLPRTALSGPSLAAIARSLRNTLRRTDVVGTTADGHVGVILPGLPPEGLHGVRFRVGNAIGEALNGSRPPEIRLAGRVVASDEADAATLLAETRHQLAERV